MPAVYPDSGQPTLLGWMLRDDTSGAPPLIMTLFKNDLTPGQTTVLSDLDIADFGGFQELVLSRAGWTVPTESGHTAQATWGTDPREWTCTGSPQTVYGYALYRPDTLDLVLCERFDPVRPVAVGDTLRVLPRVTLATYPP